MELKDYILIFIGTCVAVSITAIAIKKAKKNIERNEQRKQ